MIKNCRQIHRGKLQDEAKAVKINTSYHSLSQTLIPMKLYLNLPNAQDLARNARRDHFFKNIPTFGRVMTDF